MPEDVSSACRFANEVAGSYVPREGASLAELQQKYNVTHFVVIEKGQPIVYQDKDRFFFHRGMAELRLLNFVRSGRDPMVAAMGLEEGMTVLDCTLGLASDALVAAYAVGVSGRVLGVEASPIVASLTRWGLAELCSDRSDARSVTKQAACCIETIQADHLEYLTELADRAFDVVYFDPMFRRPKQASAGIQPLRNFADSRALTIEAIRQAVRVAKCRVVVKEAHGSREFSRLGMHQFGGGRYSPIQYGILYREETN